MNYIKKPVTIQAIQWLTSNILEVKDFLGLSELKGLDMDATAAHEAGQAPPMGSFFIETLEGDMKVSHGDYIIKGVEGEFYPCKPGIFEKTYEKEPTNFVERIELEKKELDDRIDKLDSFYDSCSFQMEVYSTQKWLLTNQLHRMRDYSDILDKRLRDLKQ